MKFILTLLLFGSFSTFLLADKDWTCDPEKVNTPDTEMVVTVVQ